ncbi:MAG: transcription termination factor Rho [Gemmatimonadales bacterium]|nr:transcription termination factor Rho [Gemmatimonadales bacterium]
MPGRMTKDTSGPAFSLAAEGSIFRDPRMTITRGILQLGGRSGGHLRRREASYLPSGGDVQVSDRLIRAHGLRTGDDLEGETGQGRASNTLERIATVNGRPAEGRPERPEFGRLPAVHPNEILRLECGLVRQGQPDPTNRLIDLLSPLGKGQRALIVAPAKAGKTMILQSIAEGVKTNYPDAALMILLVDERPEEVFEMEAAGFGEVVASSFDHPPAQHVAQAELLLERARRGVEEGRDVVLVVDSITRLARAYNAVEKGTGRTLSGGLDAQSLEKPKRFFGSARKVDPGQGAGSLTIIATALVDTGSKMDQLIFEEFKGTGNSELVLSRDLAERRVFPAIDLLASGTRKEELLLSPEGLAASQVLRKRIARRTPLEAMNDLLADFRKYRTNAELVQALAKE